MTPAGTNLLLASATAAAPAPSDVVTKSLLFNSASSSKLTWTPASSSSATSYTISLWAKRGDLGAENCLFHAGTASGNRGHIRFNSDDTLELACYNGSWFVWVATTAVFRDPSAFYHICGEINTTNGTAKLYINGVQQTALSQNTANSSSTVLPFGANIEHQIGVRGFDSAGYFGGYAADIYGIDGTALTPTSFAEEDATTGQWKPKAFVGLYGTNGFHLDFKDSSDIGKDVSVDTYITATGGTVTTDGDYKVHTFNSTGTFEVTTGNDSGVEYLVLAGGGGGGGRYGGGGGAGGYRTATGFPVTATSYSATVGAGGAAGADTDTAVGGDGSDSSFSTITSDGGGGGGPGYATGGGRDGGSGGGSGYNNNASGVGGTATAGQGYDGGTNGGGSSNGGGGGGGGAGGVGANGHLSGAGDLAGGDGGTGVSSSITGTPTDLGGGGGAGGQVSNRGAGGTGGGGQGGDATAAPAAGTTNKGGGGGGGGRWQSGYGGGGAGGSGVVIIRYKFQ